MESEEKKHVHEYALGELFCGPRGLALGAIKAFAEKGDDIYLIRHKWANDWDEDSCETYRRNICPNHPESVIYKDIKDLDWQKLGLIDIFAYGFPCNDFSIVGEQKGLEGKYGPLYTYGVKILDLFKPKAFVAENVGGLASSRQKIVLDRILNEMKTAGNGYNLTVHLYKTEEYGVPQTRRRLIIVGIDKSLGVSFKIPSPTTFNRPKTAREALENPPIEKHAKNHEMTSQSRGVVERLNHIKPGENAWTAKLPENLRLNVPNTRLSHIYRRLHPDKPSYTITGSGGGGTHTYHWEEPRALTNRERARIQTFPDDFVFEGSKESVRKQIGMAVPPHFSKIIFESLLKTLNGISYDCVEHPSIKKIQALPFDVDFLARNIK